MCSHAHRSGVISSIGISGLEDHNKCVSVCFLTSFSFCLIGNCSPWGVPFSTAFPMRRGSIIRALLQAGWSTSAGAVHPGAYTARETCMRRVMSPGDHGHFFDRSFGTISSPYVSVSPTWLSPFLQAHCLTGRFLVRANLSLLSIFLRVRPVPYARSMTSYAFCSARRTRRTTGPSWQSLRCASVSHQRHRIDAGP